ncbi:MAG: efflux RND transporter permease subunit [Myxococcaceae bacterium]|nr:MAG: efflux RND transporter permease subunit [Myxococcaceae bacterium]
MNLTRAALKNPYAIIVVALMLVAVGVVALPRMATDLLPQFRTPAVQVLTLYPGMPAPVVEADITSRLERWTGQSNGIARQVSRSLTGVSIVRNYFREDIDANTAMSQTSALAASDMYYLPPGTAPPMVMPFDPTAPIPVALLAVSSPTASERELYDIAYFRLRNLLQGIPGVIAPAVYGGRIRRILARIDPARLQQLNLSPLDVAAVLRQQNTLTPVGNVRVGALDYQLETNGIPERVEEMNRFPLQLGVTQPATVSDVGVVEDGAQIQTNLVRVDGRRQVYIPIYRQPGANTIGVVRELRAALTDLRASLPSGIALDIVFDQSTFVRRAIRALAFEAALGALLAAVMVLLFLRSLRASFVVVLTIPLSVLAAALGLLACGQSVNAMTLGGIALAIGRLVDDAIVVLENIVRHRQLGASMDRAIEEGTREVGAPIFVSTAATCIVFVPVLFLSGIGKFLFGPLALAVTFAMIASYVIALTVVPIYARRFLAGSAKVDLLAGSHDPPRGALARWYEAVLRRLTAHPAAALLLALASVGGAALVAPTLGTELFPRSDAGQITVLLRAPTGTRIERTEQYTATAERIIRSVVPRDELTKVIANVGILYDWPAAYTPNAGTSDAFLLVELGGARHEGVERYVQLLRAAFARDLPDVEVAFDAGGLLTAALSDGATSPISVVLERAPQSDAERIVPTIIDAARSVRGAVDVHLQERFDYPTVRLEVDRMRAAEAGLTAQDVVRNAASALTSSVNFEPAFWIDHRNGNHYFVGVQYRESDIVDFETILNVPITPHGGGVAVPLRQVATLTRSRAVGEVRHESIARVQQVLVNVDGRDVGSVARDIERAVAGIRLPSGAKIEVRGEVAQMRSSMTAMGAGLALAVVLVYLLLVAQFRSFVDPLLVLVAVPLGAVGALGLLKVTGSTLNVQSLVGMLFMVGIAVSNSVLIVEFAGRLRADGRAARDAAVEAALVRVRPILMTSLAALLGLTPMALGLEHGSEANAPLARAVVGGLAASTVLTMLVVPALYAWIHRSSRPSEAVATQEVSS